MARPNKLYSKPRVTSIATGDLFSTGQLQDDGTYKVKTITKENARAELLAPVSVTYAELLALSGSYDTEVSYLITNATAANINLIVQAIATNQIHCDAKDPLYPNDKVMYNFASNVITWRWDTVRDVSAGKDWRNSNNLQIPDSCTRVTIGVNAANIILGEGLLNIKIGNDCTNITIPIDCSNLEFGDACQDIILSEAASFKKICSGTSGYNFATATNFYNITAYAEVRIAQSGAAMMNYYDNDNLFVSVLA